MEFSFECKCGSTHKSNCEDIVLKKGAIKDVSLIAKKILKAGHILVVACDDTLDVVSKVSIDLEENGFKVSKMIFAAWSEYNEEIANELKKIKEEVRLIVGVGTGFVAQILANINTPSLMVLTAPTVDSILLAKNIKAVIADMDILIKSPKKALAGGYGCLFSKIVSLFDYKSSTLYSNGSECRYLIDKLDKCVNTFLSTTFERNSEEFIGELTYTLLQTSLYLSMLKNTEEFYETSGVDLVKSVCKGNLYYGEVSFIVSYYILTLYKAKLANVDNELLYPADKVNDAKILSDICGADIGSTLSKLKIIDSNKIILREHVFNEYSQDLLEELEEMQVFLKNCCKTFKRIYDDVGRDLSRVISINILGKVVNSSAILHKQYSLLKHFKELGVI